MDHEEHSPSERWLNDRAPGLRSLPEQDRRAIFDFTFLWTLFEAQIMENFARADFIRQRVGDWAQQGELDGNHYDVELAYFRSRYFEQGAFTHHFEFLNLRPSDSPDLVKSVIEGKSDEPRDKIICLLMIVWRFRNNLFHGAKWAYQLRGQFENFTHANSILMKILDRYGRI